MKTAKERILFSNYYDSEDFDYVKQYCIERHLEDCPNDIEWTPCEDEVFNELQFIETSSCDYFLEELRDFITSSTFVIQGTVNTWNGIYKGGLIVEKYEDFVKVFNNADYVKVYDKNGHLYIDIVHQDGTNYYEMRMLNDKGYDYYRNHYGLVDGILHDKLMKAPYSVLPHYAHKVLGSKKVEYEKGDN